MTSLSLLPAVDVQGGQAVQLVQGIAGSEKTYGDPLATAMRWQGGNGFLGGEREGLHAAWPDGPVAC